MGDRGVSYLVGPESPVWRWGVGQLPAWVDGRTFVLVPPESATGAQVHTVAELLKKRGGNVKFGRVEQAKLDAVDAIIRRKP